MDNPNLVLDLVEWIALKPRTYDDVMNAWRTSCPRLSVWEDAVDAEYLERYTDEHGVAMVKATTRGHTVLDAKRPTRFSRSA